MANDRVHIERRFAASPERLFQAFTDPEDLKVWSWADYGPATHVAVDLRVGGRWEIRVDAKDDQPERRMRGVYIEILPQRLVLTWHWDGDVSYNRELRAALDEVVTVDFTSDGDGTLLTWQRLGLPFDEETVAAFPGIVENHTAGDDWTLAALQRYLAD